MNELRTIRYLGRTWYRCLSRGCSALLKENPPEVLAAHPDAATHYCADWECRGLAWIVDGRVMRAEKGRQR
jgi:hypothetical protein